MVFSEYMNSLPNVKVEEIKKIAELTSSTVITVYRWIAGTIDPPLVKKKIIAEYLSKPIEELFPNTNN
ncbi:XRE family transcriptional regulator [Bacteroides thetaiotaomicron]|uniref:XRE family transcriptional regulator n=1 Tax=Bacteroides thetaiotaomicron TaxID=818 RepID=UPI003567374D